MFFFHPSHLVGKSPYPFIMSCVIYFLVTTLLMYFKYGSFFFIIYGVLFLFGVLTLWVSDICLEGLSGHHNFVVQSGFKVAFALFLFSEFMFFVSIFWVFFDSVLVPVLDIGCVWPPYGIIPPDYLGLPFFGTCLLLSSGVTVTWSHAQLLSNVQASWSLGITLLLACSFIYIQYCEYFSSSFCMGDGIYGSIFYFSTGFHGLHVIFGMLFLSFNLIRLNLMHFSSIHHVGLETAILYWHFVDVVWIILYVVVYVWGS